MLCEALRKLWTNAILTKLTAAFNEYHVLEEIQHGFVSAKGTDTASILHINHMEEVEEKTGVSHQSSFDFMRAFDSTSIPSINWGLRRVGVPPDIARDMATSDIGGTTVVRSPFAQFLWSQLPYRCVQTSGTYPTGGVPATHDSALVASFCPERGTGQGLTDSPTKWNLIFDIVATGLRTLDTRENVPTYVGAEDNGVYEHKDILYADDHKAASISAEMIQKKAELVSAFCIVLGLRLSEKKIRRVVQSFLPPGYRQDVMSTIVYTVGWTAHEVPVQPTGATEFLGGIYDTDNSGKMTLEWLLAKASLVVQCIKSRKGFSAASKVSVITMSTLHSLVYKSD